MVVVTGVCLEQIPSKYLALSFIPIVTLTSIKICKRICFMHFTEVHLVLDSETTTALLDELFNRASCTGSTGTKI